MVFRGVFGMTTENKKTHEIINPREKTTIKLPKNIIEDKAVIQRDTEEYKGFYIIKEYASSDTDKVLLSSKLTTKSGEKIMESIKEIKVILLNHNFYLFSSLHQVIIAQIEDDDFAVLISVESGQKEPAYKLTRFLKAHNLIVLTDYSKDDKREYEYLYNYATGKKLSSGYDSIDEVNGKLSVTFGIAIGDLDLDGNFILQPSIVEETPKKGLFHRLFSKSTN